MSIAVKRYKKLVKELLFTYSELEYVNEVLKGAHLEFETYYRNYCDDNNVPLDDLNSQNQERLSTIFPKKKVNVDETGIIQYDQVNEEEKQNNKVFHRMYRIIAKKIHPDKFSNIELNDVIMEKINDFKEATSAYDKKNWAKFLDICEKYDILPTRYEKINSLITKEIYDINKLSERQKLTYSWRLYECGDDTECKNNLIKEFLFLVFKYSV